MKALILISFTLLVVLVGIQFIPAESNQPVSLILSDFLTTNNASDEVSSILTTSCYNCHSNNTNYPWYSKVQPIGWFIEQHISKGKSELNFNEFDSYSKRKQKSKLTIMISQIESNDMPLPSYTFVHKEARLSQKDKKVIIDYLNNIRDSLK